jgi:hypothetical protein
MTSSLNAGRIAATGSVSATAMDTAAANANANKNSTADKTYTSSRLCFTLQVQTLIQQSGIARICCFNCLLLIVLSIY